MFTSLFVFSNFYWLENPFLQYLFILLVIVYANNFLLLPFFVGKKWYASYIFVIAFISFAATQLYCYVFAQCGCTLIKCLSDYLWQTIVPLAFLSFVWMLYRYLEKQDEIEKIIGVMAFSSGTFSQFFDTISQDSDYHPDVCSELFHEKVDDVIITEDGSITPLMGLYYSGV